MKCGTSSLAAYLDAHPSVAVSRPKEPNFFADPGNWEKGLRWYEELFSADVPIAGEATTRYTMVPRYVGAPKRIHQTIPEVKLIYLVRDPIERMRSMFVHEADKHQTSHRSLAEAIDRDPAYLEISRYGTQLQPYLDLFNVDQILVLTTDELRDSPDLAMARTFAHIGADSQVQVPTRHLYNSSSGKKQLSDSGFILARLIHKTRVREWLNPGVRRRLRNLLSADFTEDALHIEATAAEELRRALAPDMKTVRDLVAKSGALVPSWLDGSKA